MSNLFPNVEWDVMLTSTDQTLYMTAVAVIATFVIGLFLGLALFLTGKETCGRTSFFM